MLVSTDLISGRSMYQRHEAKAIKRANGAQTERNFGAAAHPFFKHLKVNSFPDRAPTYPKHHRHRRQARTTLPESSKPTGPNEIMSLQGVASNELLNKLNAIHSLLARSDPENKDNNSKSSGLGTKDLLDRVLSNLNDLIPPSTVANETPCDVRGTWLSSSAGGVFKIKPDASLVHKKAYEIQHAGFMLHKFWQINASFPYPNNTQYLLLTGIDERELLLGTYLAECRICKGQELLQGNWLVVSHSINCEGMGATGKLISDVWRRDTIDDMNPKVGKKKKHHLFEKLRHHEKSEKSTHTTTATTGTGKTKSTKTSSPKNIGIGQLHIKLH